MKRLVAILGVGMLVLAGTAQAAIVSIDFDGLDYVAGTQPPAPWGDEWDNTVHTVGADVGYLGSQALVVGDSRGVYYDLPTPLTSDMGAVSISILFNPQGFPSGWNYGSQGGVQVGWGSLKYGLGELRGVIFYHVGGAAGIYGPGSMYGTYMGSFSPYQWYQITFDIDADWLGMTISAGPIGQTPVSMRSGWSGHAITRIWTPENQASPRKAIFDNLIVALNVTCPSADLTNDCFVDQADFSVMAAHWDDSDCVAPDWCDGADFDNSGVVGLEDLEELALQWLTGTP